MGIDANHFIRPELIENNVSTTTLKMHIYPSSEEEFTTKKKRSYLQAQLNKANLLVNEVKDHIITTFEIT